MKLSLLQRTHADYDAETLRTYGDLYAGGKTFRDSVERYLPRNPAEPLAVYTRRKKTTSYINYAASICLSFAGWLFTSPLSIGFKSDGAEAAPTATAPYVAFKEDCDGSGTDFDDFLRDRFLEALVSRVAWCRVEMPEQPADSTLSRAEWEAQGLGDVRLSAVPTKSITHWRHAPNGSLAWVTEHDYRSELADFSDASETIVETWTTWYADGSARRWELRREAGKPVLPETDVPEVECAPSPTGQLPLVCLALPPGLWVLDLIADPVLEHFRKGAAQSWLIDQVCYAMPVLFTATKKKVSAMGAGYFLQLGASDKLEYPAPPSTPFDVLDRHRASIKDEIYRVVHQMAAGVDNSAAAIGRSGESKSADAAATTIILKAYAALVRGFVERVVGRVVAARGDELTVHVEGMSSFDVADAQSITDYAIAADEIGIPSDTYRRELFTRAALAHLPGANESTRNAIREEIAEGYVPLASKPAPIAQERDEEEADEKVAAESEPAKVEAKIEEVAVSKTPPATAEVSKASDLAFNGAQVTSLSKTVQDVAAGLMPADSAKQLLKIAFPSISDDEANKLIDPADGFKQAAPAAPPRSSTPSE